MSLDDEDTGNLYDFLDEIKSSEAVTYKFMSFSEKYAEFKGSYIADGEAGSFLNKAAEKSLLEAQMNWYSWGCNLWTDFDFDKQKNVIDKLHEIVRKYLPKDQIALAEEDWTGVNDDPGALVPDLQWIVSDLKNVAGFSDEVNTALEVLDGDYQINAEGLWFDLEQFAVAWWQVVDKKLQLVSVKL